MSYTITTGTHPGQPGACMAQYNHSTFKHSSHNPNHHNPIVNHPQVMPAIQHSVSSYGSYGNPSWRPPGTSYPFYY